MRSFLLLGALALGACTSTYHPEYHPVSVNSVHQNWTGAPVTVTPTSGNVPVVVVTPPMQPIVIPEQPLANPDVVFLRQ